MSQGLTTQDFDALMRRDFPHVSADSAALAVGVSGGPDSMALLKLMSEWSNGVALHALIVDHGLRAEAAAEAQGVADIIQDWPYVQTRILHWGGASDSRVQEEARHGRYDLMADYCAAQGIGHLFLGHHMDDQAETFLFRLSKGSGLDGLASMQVVQPHSEALNLARPLLEVPKADLVSVCTVHGISYVDDPSNMSSDYARGRLRAAAEILGEEGLTPKRLSVTARRLARARRALETLTDQACEKIFLEKNTDRIVLKASLLREQLDEIGFRVVLSVIKRLCPGRAYAPRMEKIEALFEDLVAVDDFRKRTLGGLIFERLDKADQIIVRLE